MREVARHSSVEHIDICEIDKMVVDVSHHDLLNFKYFNEIHYFIVKVKHSIHDDEGKLVIIA